MLCIGPGPDSGPVLHPRKDLIARHGAGHEEALNHVTIKFRNPVQVNLILHPFGDDFQVQLASEFGAGRPSTH